MKPTRRYMIGSGLGLALAAGGLGMAAGTDDGDQQATGPEADRAREAALAHSPGGRVTSVEHEQDEGGAWSVEITRPNGDTVDVQLDRRYQTMAEDAGEREDAGEDRGEREDAAGREIAGEAPDAGDQQARGAAADRAREAALARYPGGRITSIERDSDEGGTWEVDLTRRDGTPVDVELDSDYRVVVTDDDSEAPPASTDSRQR